MAKEREDSGRNAAGAERVTNGPKWRPKLDDIVSDARNKSDAQQNQNFPKKEIRSR